LEVRAGGGEGTGKGCTEQKKQKKKRKKNAPHLHFCSSLRVFFSPVVPLKKQTLALKFISV